MLGLFKKYLINVLYYLQHIQSKIFLFSFGIHRNLASVKFLILFLIEVEFL